MTHRETWDSLMQHYVGSGHGPRPLAYTASRGRQVGRCVEALGGGEEGASALVHLLRYWLESESGRWWRDHLPGSALIAALLRHTLVDLRYMAAESWDPEEEAAMHAQRATGGDRYAVLRGPW